MGHGRELGGNSPATDAAVHVNCAIGVDFVSHDEVAVKIDTAARLDGALDLERALQVKRVVAPDAPGPLELAVGGAFSVVVCHGREWDVMGVLAAATTNVDLVSWQACSLVAWGVCCRLLAEYYIFLT
jgi:hypothetical protein